MALSVPFTVSGIPGSLVAGGRDTDGRYALADLNGRPGDFIPLHVHSHEDEWIFVLDGELTVVLDGEHRTVTPLEPICMPRDVPHGVIIEGDVRFLTLWDPAGIELVLQNLALDETLPRDDVAALLASAGVHLH